MASPRKIRHNEQTMSVAAWGRAAGMSRTGMLARLKRMPKEEALVLEAEERRRLWKRNKQCLYLWDGQAMTAEEIAERERTSVHAIHERVRRGTIKRCKRGPHRHCANCGTIGHYRTTCPTR